MVLPERFLRDLSVHIGADWERLATQLDFRKSEIDCIKADNPKMLEQIFEMLVKWSRRQKCGDSAAYESLFEAMERIKRDDLAEMVKERQASKGQASDSMDSEMDFTVNVSKQSSSASGEETKKSGHTTTTVLGKTPYIGSVTVTAKDSPVIVGSVHNSTFNFGGGGSKH